jgi:Tfp pilus assembly protein PilF
MASWLRRSSRRISDWLAHQAGPNGAYGAGLHYLRRGKPAAAEVAFRDAQRLWEAKLGPRHGYVAMALAKRAWCAVHLGRVQEGVELYERALAIETELRGKNSARVRELTDELDRARGRLDVS